MTPFREIVSKSAPNREICPFMGVNTFISLISSYIRFLVPALSPWQGRLKKENVRKKANGEKIM